MKKGHLYAIFKAPSTKLGFTLSELLVSLGVLGLIAGLTVPSVINSVQTAKTKALQKETIQVISQIMQEGVMNGDLTPMFPPGSNGSAGISNQLVQYFTQRFNARQCPKVITTAPCNHDSLNTGLTTYHNDHSGRWVFNNGVKVSFFPDWMNNGWTGIGFMIDTKPEGTNVPAVVGGDQLLITCNFSDTPLPWSAILASGGSHLIGLKPAQCGAGTYYAYNFKPQFDAL